MRVRCSRSWIVALGVLVVAFVSRRAVGQDQAVPPPMSTGTIEGTVFDSLVTRAPLKGASVFLIGTTVVATTDDRGRFTMTGVPAGQHTLTFSHALLDSAGVQAPQFPVRVAPDAKVRFKGAIPSGPSVIAANCRGPRDEATGLLLGTVRNVDTSAPIAGARVATRWFEISLGRGGPKHDNLQVSATSDANGVYRLCGIPIDIPLFVRAVADSQQSGRVEVFSRTSAVVFRDFTISRRDSAAKLVSDSALDAVVDSAAAFARPPGSVRIVGSVRDQNGRALANATVSVLDRPGSARSDADGRFTLIGVPAGSQTIELRALGFAPTRRTVSLRSGATETLGFTLDRSATTLAEVRIMGTRSRPAISRSGFEDRRRSAAGWSVDADEISKIGAIYVGDLLRRAPGMMAQYNARGERSYTMRSMATGDRCTPTYFVDGVRWFSMTSPAIVELDRYLTTHELYGIEVYGGGASTPIQFDVGSGCGVVVFWTKR